MRVLVIGGGGFLGSELVTQLAKSRTTEVAVLDTYVHGFPEKMPKKKNIIPPIMGNIRNFYNISCTIEKVRPDVVVHLAAFITRPENIGDFRKCAEINYVGTANILDACTQINRPGKKVVKKIVFASCEAARNPQSNFGITKRASEQLLEAVCPVAGIDLAILRFAEIFGCSKSQTSGSVVNHLVDHMLVGTGIGLFGVTAQKDHVHISDATRALLLAVKDTETPVCNVDIGPGVGGTIQEVVEKVKAATGFKGSLKYLEHPAVRMINSISNPEAAKELWGFECLAADFETQLSDLVKKRRKDLR